MKKFVSLTVLAFVAITVACGGSPEAEIETTFNAVVAAMKAGDFEKVKALAVEGSEEFGNAEEFKAAAGFLKEIDFTISDIKVDGDSATAVIKMAGEVMGQKMDESSDAAFTKVGGKWLMSKMKGE